MSTQPRPGNGAMALLAWVLAAFSASRSAATPWPEPFGRAKLQSPAASGKVAVGLGTVPFCTAQPSVGVMFWLIAPVAGSVALYEATRPAASGAETALTPDPEGPAGVPLVNAFHTS